MIDLETPNGISVRVPEALNEDRSPRFTAEQSAEAKAYYEQNGYVIFSGILDKEKCGEIRSLWDAEIKPSDRFIYRQATAKSERNIYNERNWVMNPILNLQSLDPRYFGSFREKTVEDVLGDPKIATCFNTLLGEKPKIVQSMYFEGNSATWEHQDTYYLDSELLGSMAAAWVALEDINAKAGRFFICPGSQNIERDRQNKNTNIATNHEVYIENVVNEIKKREMEIRAPLLESGDVLFWHSYTMHGALNSQDLTSRSSITMHAIPASHKFQQFQKRIFEVPTDEINGTLLWRPKDQARLKNRLIFFFESHFPWTFYTLKSLAIRILIR